MSRNGALSLKKIIITYNPRCRNPAVRQFLGLYLPVCMRQFPSVEFDIRPRPWPEAAITGVFADGSEKAVSTRVVSSMSIWLKIHSLVRECNDYNVKFSQPYLHFHRRSVQGTWNPWLFMAERNTPKKQPVRWDRKLSEPEWTFFVKKFSDQMKHEDKAVDTKVRELRGLPEQFTAEVSRRWEHHVAPNVQTDLDHNLAVIKKNFERGVKQPPVRMQEYQLFAMPMLDQLGGDALMAIRSKELQTIEKWWEKRKETLKPPK